jgi:hypothetical protein
MAVGITKQSYVRQVQSHRCSIKHRPEDNPRASKPSSHKAFFDSGFAFRVDTLSFPLDAVIAFFAMPLDVGK